MKKLLCALLLAVSTQSYALQLSDMKAWGYQLHGPERLGGSYTQANIERMKNSKNTLWVIDYSKDGSDEMRFTKEEIASIKKNNNMVVAYFCLGEAEMARFYWPTFNRNALIQFNEAPSLGYDKEYTKNEFKAKVDHLTILARSNGEYADNFPVKYWLPEWQNVMLSSYLPAIMDAGFDGVYLDTVDAFEYYDKKMISTRAKQMQQFVLKIGAAARKVNPNFTLMMQNAMSIIDHLNQSEKNDLFSYVSGFGVEDLFHPGEGDDNRRNFSKYDEYDQIQSIRNEYRNISFFTVDYIPGRSAADKAAYFKDAKAYNLIPVIANRNLDGDFLLLSN